MVVAYLNLDKPNLTWILQNSDTRLLMQISILMKNTAKLFSLPLVMEFRSK